MTDVMLNSPDGDAPNQASPDGLPEEGLPEHGPPGAEPPYQGVPEYRPGNPKRQHGVALTWWTFCTIWAYFAFGELVVAAGYPEALAIVGVAGAFTVAGHRVKSLFDDAKAVAIGAAITALLSAILAIVVPALLVTLVGRRYVALLGLLLTIVVALLALRRVRKRERAEQQGASPNPSMARIIVWLLVVVFTAVALTLAVQE